MALAAYAKVLPGVLLLVVEHVAHRLFKIAEAARPASVLHVAQHFVGAGVADQERAGRGVVSVVPDRPRDVIPQVRIQINPGTARRRRGARAHHGHEVRVRGDAVRNGQDADWKNLSQVLYGFVGTLDYHAGKLYDFGSLKREAGPAAPLPTGYPSFAAGDRGRLKFSRDAADYFGPDGLVGPDASNRLRGLVLHDILASVTVPGDLPRAVDRAVASGELPQADRGRTLAFLEAEIASVAARGWFAESGIEVLNEAPLLGADGAEARPDRVVLRPDGSAAVIDYKFGQPEKKYLDQVRGYMDLYRALGHNPVTGTLWYIRENGEDEFVEV